MEDGDVQELGLVVKADVQGSVEAAVSEIEKIQHAEVRVRVIHSGVGGITESDVNLAAASGALIVGFNVRPSPEARALAEREGVEIRTYRVIYQLTEDIEQALVGMLRPVSEEVALGEAEVRALIRISRFGTIAGSYVTRGMIRRGVRARIVRDGAARLRDDDRLAEALQGGRARGHGRLRVRHPPRGLRRRQGRRRHRGVRGAPGRANGARRVGATPAS